MFVMLLLLLFSIGRCGSARLISICVGERELEKSGKTVSGVRLPSEPVARL